jgi:hypothetical protein
MELAQIPAQVKAATNSDDPESKKKSQTRSRPPHGCRTVAKIQKGYCIGCPFDMASQRPR